MTDRTAVVKPWRRHLLLGLLLLSGGLSAACFQLASTPSMGINFDVGVHLQRSARAYWLLRNGGQPPDVETWVVWSGMLGDRSGVPELEGNHYGPAMYLFTGAAFLFCGPSVRGAILLLAPMAMLLMLSAWGFARECWEDDGLACLCAGLVMASPCVMLHSHLFFLDVPLAAMAGLSLWMLMASRDFTRRAPSMVMGLAMGLGALIKPTFILYVGLPVAWKAVAAAWRSLRGWVPRVVFTAAVAACGYGLVQFIWWISLGSPHTERMGIIERTAWCLGGAAVPWLALRVLSRLLPAPDQGRRRAWENCLDGLGLSLVLAAAWNFACIQRLGPGLLPNNPGEPSGLGSVVFGLWYYLWSIKNDVVLWPLFPLLLLGVPLAFLRPAWRGHAWMATLALGGVFILSIHGGRLARYVLPWMVPLAWFAVVPVALLGARARRIVVALALTWCVLFNWSWSVGDESRMRYVEWGNRTVPEEGWDRLLPLSNPPAAYWMADLPRQGGEWVDACVNRTLELISRSTGGTPTWIAVAPSPEFRMGQNVLFHCARFTVESEMRGLSLRFSPREDLVTDTGAFMPQVDLSQLEVDAVLVFMCRKPPPSLGPFQLQASFRGDPASVFAFYARSRAGAPPQSPRPRE